MEIERKDLGIWQAIATRGIHHVNDFKTAKRESGADLSRAIVCQCQENYYTEGRRIVGQWHGKLAAQWGLTGAVNEEHFARLASGHHPTTNTEVVRHRAAYEYTNSDGKKVHTMEHRAGWDATFAAPKSVSLTALVGGDERVQQAHRESVDATLKLEKYTQARIGGNHPAETTGRWVAAKFEHDSSRPVDGYAAPQLHTHVVIFNVTQRENGETRALQPRELYRSQQYATAVYRSELALRLRGLGYEIEQRPNGAPEIKGYSQEYLDASSPRRGEIQRQMTEEGKQGAAHSAVIQHRSRHSKLEISHKEMQRQHRELAQRFGNQAEQIVSEARLRTVEMSESHEASEEERQIVADRSVRYSIDRNFEREAVNDDRVLMRDALKRSLGYARLSDLHEEFGYQMHSGKLKEIVPEPGIPGRAFTTDEMVRLERDNIHFMRSGRDQHPALVPFASRSSFDHEHLTQGQREAVQEILGNRDQVYALEGVAGAGKTTALTAVRQAIEQEGFTVQGLAPTSRAAHQLEAAGIDAMTLQRHLARGQDAPEGQKHLYILDESSLASTRMMNEFFHRLAPDDRVLLVGDTRQHEAVEAGRPYQQLQEAGMRIAHLDEIVRQKDPRLKQVVELLAETKVHEAVKCLDQQGRIREMEDRQERFTAMAKDYVRHPEKTLVVSPDHESCRELNLLIHRQMQEQGYVKAEDRAFRVLEARQELTGADRAWAEQYQPGDIVRYSKGSRVFGIEAGEYATVIQSHGKDNLLTVQREDGHELTYDPRRLQGTSVYREAERQFAEGERVQFTAPSKDLHVSNRELGTIERIAENGELSIRTDSGRTVRFDIEEHPHLDYGYTVTSHASQGQTADRVLIHADTEEGEQLVNSRMAYVAVSRSRYDAQIYTNDKDGLASALSREIDQSTATGQKHEHAHDFQESSSHGHDNASEVSQVQMAGEGPSQEANEGEVMGEGIGD